MIISWKEYNGHEYELVGKNKKIDNTIYTFDIETTSYYIYNNKIYSAINYINLEQQEQKKVKFMCSMYIWMFSINDVVYYGRTWEEFISFLKKLEKNSPNKKIVYIHNFSFEFQFIKSILKIDTVLARKKRKVMTACLTDYNIEIRCSYILTNCGLQYLPDIFKLPVEKQVGDLDYKLLRHSGTKLTEKELKYCENDCLVIYYYIKVELEKYKTVDKIPITSTGHVRRELKARVLQDYNYRRKVNKAINTDPHIYNLLVESFGGGYTHSNYVYTDEIIENVESYDFTSSYPYIMVTHQFPSTEFKKCKLKKKENMLTRFAYLLVVKFSNVRCKFFNTFISKNKCRTITKGVYDNGRIISAKSIEIVLTDIDFKLICEQYYCEYEIIESYYSRYDYLPIQFINFILEKYENKTKYKNVKGKEIEYAQEKGKFNALYGMSVTNTIRDNVVYDNDNGWDEQELTNEEIIEALDKEKEKSFLSFAYGNWVTAWGRYNIQKNVMLLDEYVIYCDTDSLKLLEGYNNNIIDIYNNNVKKKIEYVSDLLSISRDKFAPTDIQGKKHLLGIFEKDGKYDKFITQGAKKYAYEIDGEISITVAGVPKKGSKELKSLDEFRDNFVFSYENTNKNLIVYCEDMPSHILIDYQGNECEVTDKSGCCLIPTNYTLGKSLEYSMLISDNSSSRARYKEGK